MEAFNFSTEKPFYMKWIGKFQAPDENWIHMTRPLVDYEFVLVTDGDFYIGDEDKSFIVHKGEYIILKPTSNQHGTRNSGCSFYWMHFLAESGNPSISLPVQGAVPRPERLIVLLKQLQDCDKKYGNQNLNNYLCTALLSELACQLEDNSSSGKNDSALRGAQVALYSDIQNYINWRIYEDIRVGEIASYFGYNDKYITTFFKKASGKPIKQFILERKIDVARAMLSDSTNQVSQIGYKLGFSDNHNFARAFKKITGQSPTEYRDTYSDRMLYHK